MVDWQHNWNQIDKCLTSVSSIKPPPFLFLVFDAILSITDMISSINPSPNVFVFEDFSISHNEWSTYSGGKTLNNLTRKVNFPPRILDGVCHCPALSNLLISSEPNISLAFVLWQRSIHWEILIIFSVSLHSQKGCPFSLYSLWLFPTYWDDLCNHLRDFPWEIIFKLNVFATTVAAYFCGWV